MKNTLKVFSKLTSLACLCAGLLVCILALNLLNLKDTMLEERKTSISQAAQMAASTLDYYWRLEEIRCAVA